MAKRRLSGMRAIVTGASSGIGRETARELARAGVNVVATARRIERLEELRLECSGLPGDIAVVAGDVTDRELRGALVQTARDTFGGLDILVNNAGIGAVGPFAQADEERLRKIFEVNLFAPLELIREALPLLRSGRTPVIVNVGSVLGHFAVPSKSEYCASKFALHGFSDALRAELREEGIGVLLVSPSTTESEFFEKARSDGADAADLKRQAKERRAALPDAVARKIVRAIRSGHDEIILSAGGKLGVWADRLAPGLFNRLMSRFAPK
jgi:short-subunit dehydrogenase